MKIEEILSQYKPTVLKKWFQLILETYPTETTRFLQKEKDQFANPVGSTILGGIEELFEKLINTNDSPSLPPFFDRLIHIRAVQEFTPSQAISFLFGLKKIIREELKNELTVDMLFSQQLLNFESRIDEFILLAFNRYIECREKVYELRVNEIKNRYSGILRRLNLIQEV